MKSGVTLSLPQSFGPSISHISLKKRFFAQRFWPILCASYVCPEPFLVNDWFSSAESMATRRRPSELVSAPRPVPRSAASTELACENSLRDVTPAPPHKRARDSERIIWVRSVVVNRALEAAQAVVLCLGHHQQGLLRDLRRSLKLGIRDLDRSPFRSTRLPRRNGGLPQLHRCVSSHAACNHDSCVHIIATSSRRSAAC